MAIRRRKIGDVVYLEEYHSYRVNGKVKTEFVRYLGREGSESSTKHVIDKINHSDALRVGDVALLWAIAKNLQIPQTIDRFCAGVSASNRPTPGILLTVWAINRVLYPESATQLENWISATDLPRLTGVPAEVFNKDAFLDALDYICGEDQRSGRLIDQSKRIEEELYRIWRKNNPLPKTINETLAYDLTSVLFFGVTCPLAEFGYNPNDITDRMQVNLALLVTKTENMPVMHSIYEGNRHGVETVRNLLASLPNASGSGTLIWDRGMVSRDHVNTVKEMGWELICGLPKTIAPVQQVLDAIDVPLKPETIVRYTKTTRVYAVETIATVYGEKRHLVVYTNHTRAAQERDTRNAALAEIANSLDKLSDEHNDWSEAKLHHKIAEIVGSLKPFISVKVGRKDNEPRIVWRYSQHALRAAERGDGKWILLATDPKVSAEEAVNEYLEKDFIEKSFRTMKTDEEVEPVRHRLERRVRAYMFVQALALRLRAELRWRIKKNGINKEQNAWEAADNLLDKLGRVQRVQILLGKEQRIWYLNLQKNTNELLKKIDYGGLFAK